jgi:AcrR family transcriptional regulator
MGRRNDHTPEELQRMMLEAASFIVEAQGLAALSARKVGRRVGYTAGTLYRIFRNLDDLVIQLNSQTLTELNAVLERAASDAQCSPQRCISALAHSYIAFANRHTRRWSALFEHGIEADIRMPTTFLEQIAAPYTRVETSLHRLAPQRSPQEVVLAARALWSGIHGICMLALNDRLALERVETMPAIADCLIDSFIEGFRSERA